MVVELNTWQVNKYYCYPDGRRVRPYHFESWATADERNGLGGEELDDVALARAEHQRKLKIVAERLAKLDDAGKANLAKQRAAYQAKAKQAQEALDDINAQISACKDRVAAQSAAINALPEAERPAAIEALIAQQPLHATFSAAQLALFVESQMDQPPLAELSIDELMVMDNQERHTRAVNDLAKLDALQNDLDAMLLGGDIRPLAMRRPFYSWTKYVGGLFRKTPSYLRPPKYHRNRLEEVSVRNAPNFCARVVSMHHMNQLQLSPFKCDMYRKLLAELTRRGATVVLVSPPARKEYFEIAATDPVVRDGYQAYDAFRAELAKEFPSFYWDKAAACGFDESIFVDYGHYTIDGGILFSNYLAETLRKKGLAPAAATPETP